jgi:PAS domain S-box-containing protein
MSTPVELSQELLLQAHLDGKIQQTNPAWTTLLGWSESDLRGQAFADLVHPDEFEKTRDALRSTAESGNVYTFEARCRTKDGSYRWVSWKALARENVLHGAGTDVTAFKDAVAALQGPRNNDTRVAAHDLNNLMQNIVAALELVRKMIGAGRVGETERFIVKAIESAHRAAELNQKHFAASPAPESKSADDQRV